MEKTTLRILFLLSFLASLFKSDDYNYDDYDEYNYDRNYDYHNPKSEDYTDDYSQQLNDYYNQNLLAPPIPPPPPILPRPTPPQPPMGNITFFFISNTINYRLFTLKSQPEEYKVYHFEGFDLFLMSISFLHSMPYEYKQYGMDRCILCKTRLHWIS